MGGYRMKKIKILKATENTRVKMLNKFGSSKNNIKIAEKCLQLCEDWAIIKSGSMDEIDIKSAKKSCKKYVKENLAKDEAVGSLFFSIVMGIIVKLIVDWIVNNFIYNLKK